MSGIPRFAFETNATDGLFSGEISSDSFHPFPPPLPLPATRELKITSSLLARTVPKIARSRTHAHTYQTSAATTGTRTVYAYYIFCDSNNNNTDFRLVLSGFGDKELTEKLRSCRRVERACAAEKSAMNAIGLVVPFLSVVLDKRCAVAGDATVTLGECPNKYSV